MSLTSHTPTIASKATGMILLAMTLSAPAYAGHRENVLGTTINVSGGIGKSNSGAASFGGVASRQSGNYGLYPSLSLNSMGPSSTLDFNYAFGLSDRDLTSGGNYMQSHSTSATLTSRFSPRWSMNASDSFSVTHDSGSFSSMRGVPSGSGSGYLFNPVTGGRQKPRTNQAQFGLDYSMTQRSKLGFSVSHNLRDYNGLESSQSDISNQQRVTASATFTRQMNATTSWNTGYTVTHFGFKKYTNALSHSVKLGFSRELGRDFTLTGSGGATHVQNIGVSGRFASYDVSGGLKKTVAGNVFSLDVSQESGNSTGLGALSRTRRAGLSFQRRLNHVINLFADGSAYESRGILSSSTHHRGALTSANIGFQLTKTLSLQVGGHYQRSQSASPFDVTQKRLFVSLRYSQPDLLHSR